MSRKDKKVKSDEDLASGVPEVQIQMEPIARSDRPPAQPPPRNRRITPTGSNFSASTSQQPSSRGPSHVATLTPTSEQAVIPVGSALMAAPPDLNDGDENILYQGRDLPRSRSRLRKTYFNMMLKDCLQWKLYIGAAVAIFALLLFLIVMIVMLYKSNKAAKKSEELALWKLLNSSIDHSVAPCDDFYNHTCGNFFKVLIYNGIETFMEMPSKYNAKLIAQGLMVEEGEETSKSYAVMYLLAFYSQCTDAKTRNDLSLLPFDKALQEVIGGHEWPIKKTSGHSENLDASWMDAYVQYAVMMGTGPLFDIDVIKSKYNPEKKVFMITVNEDFLKYHHSMARDYIRSFNNQQWQPEFDNLVEEITSLTHKFSDVKEIDLKLDEDDKVIEYFTLAEFAKTYPTAPNFKALLSKMATIFGVKNLITSTTEIHLLSDSLSFFANAGHVLSKTPPRQIKNFFGWLFLFANREASRVINDGTNLHEQCTEMLKKPFLYAWSRMYIDQLVKDTGGNREKIEKIRTKATEIINSLKDNIGRELRKEKWLDDETRDAAIEKLNAIKLMIAYEDWIFDDDKLDAYMQMRSAPNMEDGAFMHNWYNWNRFLVATSFKDFLKKPTFELVDSYDVPNAYYDPRYNGIFISIGFLQRPIFDLSDPDSILYGYMGTVMAHEIIHAFDANGAEFDKTGSVKLWWTQNTIDGFEKGATCFAEQYGNITEPITGQQLDGFMTISENIADNGGIKQSYLTFKWQHPGDTRSMMKSSEYSHYSPEQLFFYAFAMSYCDVNRPDSLANDIQTDSHTLNKYRVIVPLQNLPQFSSVFNCPTGSNMNPKHKCALW